MTTKHTKKTSLSTVTAAAVTAGLFFTMSQLIASDEVVLEPLQTSRWIDPIQVIETEDIDPYIDPIVEPPKKIKPPKIKIIEPPRPCLKNCITLPVTEIPENGGFTEIDPIDTDRGAFLLVASPPQYPVNAANKSIEGYVTLSFTIDENGMVQNPSIVDADPEGVFDRTSLKAIKRFKFKPAMMAGIPQPTHNVQYKLSYELPK